MNWMNVLYVIIAIMVIAAIASLVCLWLNQRRLDRQGDQIKRNARADFEQAAVRATKQGWHAEAKLARALRDLWK